jgi:site-specific recombinase XerD
MGLRGGYRGVFLRPEACHHRPLPLLGVPLADLSSDPMQIRVEQGKGRKDRYTILSARLLEWLREY